jgi:hypothetical protein
MARKFRQPTSSFCDCGSGLYVLTHSRVCQSCEAYNAAVCAVRAAAESLAKARCKDHVYGNAWLNKYGCFATSEEFCGIQVASADEVKPFDALWRLARDAAVAEQRKPEPFHPETVVSIRAKKREIARRKKI